VARLVTPDGRALTLSAGTFVVGRAADCDVVLADGTVSGHHARVVVEGGVCILCDLDSQNGTWVNRQRLTAPHTLSAGDRVAFGQTICTFHEAEESTWLSGNVRLAGEGETRAVSVSASPVSPSPLFTLPPDELGVALKTWDRAPQAEGRVLDAGARFMEKKDNIGGKVALAVGLAMVAAPLAWIPFAMDRNEVPVQPLRIHDVHTGRQISVKMIGDPSGNIAVGDVVAVWGAPSNGDLVMQAAYNYTTGSQIHLKV
jgi:hypothetical protein